LHLFLTIAVEKDKEDKEDKEVKKKKKSLEQASLKLIADS
jgi:hypothetical protein